MPSFFIDDQTTIRKFCRLGLLAAIYYYCPTCKPAKLASSYLAIDEGGSAILLFRNGVSICDE